MPAAFVLTGLAPANVVYGPWASTTISLAIGSLVMANCLAECGLLERLSYTMLQKCGGKFTTVCWSIFAVATVLSIFTFGNIAFVIAALVAGMIKVLGIEKTKEANVLMLGTMYACLQRYGMCIILHLYRLLPLLHSRYWVKLFRLLGLILPTQVGQLLYFLLFLNGFF